MDGVLEASVGLCVWKLAISLLFLPSMAASHSPISFCCCCLLIFTDFLLTTFLGFLCICERWLTDLTAVSDVIALRFLLFLSHTYGAVLLMTTPLMAVEALTHLLPPRFVPPHRTSCTASACDGRYVGEVTVEDEEEEEEDDSNNQDKERSVSPAVSSLCCLSVWVVAALNVTWRQEEVWAADCLRRTSSLIGCLPDCFSPMSSTLSPCWITAFLSLSSLILTISSSLQRPQHNPRPRREKHGLKVSDIIACCWQAPVPAPAERRKPAITDTSVSAAARYVDPETTDSTCSAHRAASWNVPQVSALHRGDFGIVSPECLSAGHEQDGTKTEALVRFSAEDPEYSSQWGAGRRWGFPSLGVNVMIGLMGVLSFFVLPLNLGVNILLIRTVEGLLDLCIRALVLSLLNTVSISNKFCIKSDW